MSTEHGKSLNAADLAAARRFIAQFNGEADGRHNSTAFAQRQTETKPVQEEKTNELPVAYQPMHEGLRFVDGFQRYMQNLYHMARIRNAAREAILELLSDFRHEAFTLEAVAEGQFLNIAPRVRPAWTDCEIGDYCQISGVEFEIYNSQQRQVMLVPFERLPRDFEWCGARPGMTSNTRTFQ